MSLKITEKHTNAIISNPPSNVLTNIENILLLSSVHLGALLGVSFVTPYSVVQTKTLVLTFVLWAFSSLGITVGYHRFWSHKSFSASLGTRILLSIFGTLACERSIKWWVIRHRLHHRFTDDPVNDPYAFSRGFLFSHVGWLFCSSTYPKLNTVDMNDLKGDSVVELQDKYFIPAAVFLGFVAPTLIGCLWGDAIGALVWGGFVHKLLIWHSTFCVNSLAHWTGPQTYTDEMSAKGNLLLAILCWGEGNHNFHHAFPFDYRASPGKFEYDPSKWLILLLAQIGSITKLKRADDEDINYAIKYMSRKRKAAHSKEPLPLHEGQLETGLWTGPIFNHEEAEQHIRKSPATSCFVVIYGYLVDVTKFMKDHPGGAAIFRPYSVRVRKEEIMWQDATWAFTTHNHHTMNARRRVRLLTVAKLHENEK